VNQFTKKNKWTGINGVTTLSKCNSPLNKKNSTLRLLSLCIIKYCVPRIFADGSVLFDHNANGQKTSTGWIAPTDGLLVMDRNGNGTIDTGRELFGDNTLKTDGTLAQNGFDALADLDSNVDGLIDNKDNDFNKLRVWRDLNQDGISQSNELFTLNQLNIQSIGTASDNVFENIGNNNQTIAKGTFTFKDGHTSTAAAAASLNLSVNNFHREFTDTLPIPEALQALPDMQGSGDVRDLKEAATLSPTLASLLDNYSKATTKAEQLAQLDGLLDAWAHTANFNQLTDRIDDAQVPGTSSTLKFRITKPAGTGSGSTGSGSGINLTPYYDASELKVGRFADRRNVDVLAKIQILEVFNNQNFFDFSLTGQDNDNNGQIDRTRIRIGSGNTNRYTTKNAGPTGILPADVYLNENDFSLSAPQMAFIEQAYDALKQSIYDGLLLQTRLAPLTDSIEIEVVDGALKLNFAPMEALMHQAVDANAVNGLTDLIDFNRTTQGKLQESGWRGSWSFMGETLRGLDTITPEVQALLDTRKISFLTTGDTSTLDGSTSSDILLGNALDNVIDGKGGADILTGGSGNDTITTSSGEGAMLDGGTGNDKLTTSGNNGSLIGGAGNDTLTANYGANNTFNGGKGNDYLVGSYRNDNYLFNLGDGKDIIVERAQWGGDDILKFGASIAAADISVNRVGQDLLFSHRNGTDHGCSGDTILNYTQR